MLNATATRALLWAMILVCAPAMAIIPPSVEIRLAGAELVGPHAYGVAEGNVITLQVRAQPGDLIWAFAAPLNDAGEADYSFVVTLLFDRDVKSGVLSGDFKIPGGLEGQRFQIEALALSDKGEASWGTTVMVSVLEPGPGQTDPTDPASADLATPAVLKD